jgi:hypothetical protein
MEAFLVSISTVALAEMGDRTQLLSFAIGDVFIIRAIQHWPSCTIRLAPRMLWSNAWKISARR